MIHLLADDETPLSILADVVEPVVIYDPTGTKVIGQFTPADPERGRQLYAEVAASIDLEEIERQANSGDPVHPVAELWKRLAAQEANGAVAEQAPAKQPDASERTG